MIKPTVGRVVWFDPNGVVLSGMANYFNQVMAGTIAYVHSDRMVNLSVTDHDGKQHAVTSVTLLQPEDPVPENGYGMYCQWMPYQKGQAAKTEELERQVGQVEASEPQAEKTALELGAAARAAWPEASYEN